MKAKILVLVNEITNYWKYHLVCHKEEKLVDKSQPDFHKINNVHRAEV